LPLESAIAKTLNVEMQDLFSFNHQKGREELIGDINNLLAITNDDCLRLAYKVLHDIVI